MGFLDRLQHGCMGSTLGVIGSTIVIAGAVNKILKAGE